MKRYFTIWIVNAENNKFSKKNSDAEFKRTKDSNRIRKIRKVFEDRCEYFIQLKMMIRNIGKKIFQIYFHNIYNGIGEIAMQNLKGFKWN